VYPQTITWGVSLYQHFLYLNNDPGGLVTWNVSNPNFPSYATTYPQYRGDVVDIGNNYVVVGGVQSCSVLNMTNPSNPVVVSSFQISNGIDVAALDTLLFFVERDIGLKIISVATPSLPTLICEINNTGISSVAIERDRLYAGLTSGGLSVYDITIRSNPVLIGSIAGTSTARRLVVRDGIVYVANFNAGVTVYNANNTENIQVINSWHGFTSGNSCDVLLSGNQLFVANGTDGLWAFDVTNPSVLSPIGRFRNCSPIILRLRENYLYTAEYSNGFSIYRIDTAATVPQTTFELTHPNGGERLVINSLDTIRWNTNNNYNAVMIKINYNYPNGDWVTIDGSSPNDGQEVWMVTGPTTNHARIKICAVAEPDTMDISESDFEISTSGLMDVADNLPISSNLARVYPNPFNQTTSFNFTLKNAENVRVDVFNLRGQLVESLISERMSAGEHTVKWFANKHASGTYLYRLQAGKQVLTDRVVLLK
ncbi:MAG: T9SS type A sorting domain-containing protein, partial [bacterium]|nr:T9SS type A sorting domain-containing protein [bacterium]